MAGLDGASKRRKITHAVDMTEEPVSAPKWSRPPDDRCEKSPAYPMTPEGGDPEKDRIKVEIWNDRETYEMVRFAIVQQVHHKGRWRDVVVIDTSHDDEVHTHRYARSTFERVGDPEHLGPIAGPDDVQDGYEEALGSTMRDWERNKRGWENA